jgi:hypothetical protein
MRVLHVLLFTGCFAATTHGQGTVFFANRLSASIFAPVFNGGGTGLSGSGWFAQLFAGPAGSAESSLQPMGDPVTFRTGAGAGAWIGTPVTVAGVAFGQQAAMQARVWYNNGMTIMTYQDAVAAGVCYTVSAVFTSLPLGGVAGVGSPPFPEPNIVGNADPRFNLQSFGFLSPCVPEPSVVVLGLVGALALGFRRRRG